MIKFSDMSAAALKLANDSKKKYATDDEYRMHDAIYKFIRNTSNACDNIGSIAVAKKEFCDEVYAVKGIDTEVYHALIRFIAIDEITQDNVHAYMVSIIKLAELLRHYHEGTAAFYPDLTALRDSLSIIPMVNNSFYYKSRVAKVYYTINAYNAIIMHMACSGEDPTAVKSKYDEMLKELYHILMRRDYYGNAIASELHNCITNDANASFKHISALHSIAIRIDNMITDISFSDDTLPDDYSVVSIILGRMQTATTSINSKIINSGIADFSNIAYYVKKYIAKSIMSDTPWDGRTEFTSAVQCIAEDNKYELSAFDSQCVRAIMTFNTCVEDVDTERAYAKDIYSSCISALEQLINAHTIAAAMDAANSIAKLLPSCKVSKSISIGATFETEKCTANDEPGKKDENTDDPSDCSKPISWNEYFMELAETAAKRSKDPRSKVGACIMDPRDHRVVSLGYNGFPYGCSDDEFPWSREGDDNKYLYVVHAELNAILSARKDLTGCVLFVTYSPCNECMKAIIQSGIKAVVYKNEYKPESHINIASTKMAKAAGVSIIKYDDLLETGDVLEMACNVLLKSFEHEAE